MLTATFCPGSSWGEQDAQRRGSQRSPLSVEELMANTSLSGFCFISRFVGILNMRTGPDEEPEFGTSDVYIHR